MKTRSICLPVILLGIPLFALGTHAETRSGHARTIQPCDPKGAAYAAADQELQAIGAAIKDLKPDGKFAPLVERIVKLAEGPCFELMSGVSLHPTSAFSLREYWNSGGYSHMRGSLDLATRDSPIVWVEPSVRRALTSETVPKSPLRSLLCPATDESCAAETRGWEIRAEAALARAAELADERRRVREQAEAQKRAASGGESCEARAKRAPSGHSFLEFRDCLDDTPDRRVALPLGHLRAPAHGWLLVSGRRGHYQFCDQTHAYDLDTGSAYRVGTCSSLALRPSGSVDHRATDDGRYRVLELGHLPVAALREAAWMLLLMDEVDQDVRVAGWGRAVPAGVAILAEVSDQDGLSLTGWGHSFSLSSGDTTLYWRLVESDRELKSGKLTWPEERNDPERDHALTLLKVAEAGFAAGCPELAAPLALVRGKPQLSASRLDTDPASLDRAAKRIKDGWQEAADQQRTCRRARTE